MYSRYGGAGRDRRGDRYGEEEIMPPKRHTSEMIPPNYGGSVFDRPDRDGGRDEERGDRASVDRDRRPPEPPLPPPPPRDPCDGCEARPPRPPRPIIPGGLQSDDVLLLGLLILLLPGGADDDIIVMLAFLLVSTMKRDQ